MTSWIFKIAIGLLVSAHSFPAFASWWDSSVIYEVFVRSFQDSNADGIGDFKGLTERLDYINSGNSKDPKSLGADAIWLMPIFQSPSYHGYDTTDYKTVNPDYGTLDDFKELVKQSHARGIKVILDLAVNHTSNNNAWFKQSKLGDSNPFHDWYLWQSDNPGWTQCLGRWWPFKQELYYSSFAQSMPDLNWANNNVMLQIKDVLHYWSGFGVDGFRLDAARYYVKGPAGEADTPGTHQVLQSFIQDLKKDYPQAFFVGEVWASSDIISSYVNTGTELDSAFNFPQAYGIQNSLGAENADSFDQSLNDTLSTVQNLNTLSPFLTNHDMVRIASVVNNPSKLKLAAVALLTLPGAPVIYYGEEIGLANNTPVTTDDLEKRAPMQWDGTDQYGFTDASAPWQPFSNASTEKNAEAELQNSTSLLSQYQSLIRLRKSEPALLKGDSYALGTNKREVAAYARILNGEAVYVVLNFSNQQFNDVNFTIPSAQNFSPQSQVSIIWGQASVGILSEKGSPSISLNNLNPYSAAIVKMTSQ